MIHHLISYYSQKRNKSATQLKGGVRSVIYRILLHQRGTGTICCLGHAGHAAGLLPHKHTSHHSGRFPCGAVDLPRAGSAGRRAHLDTADSTVSEESSSHQSVVLPIGPFPHYRRCPVCLVLNGVHLRQTACFPQSRMVHHRPVRCGGADVPAPAKKRLNCTS